MERIDKFLKEFLLGFYLVNLQGIIFFLKVVNQSREVQNTILITGKGLVPNTTPTQNWLSRYFFVWHLGATQKDWKCLCLS